MPWIIALSVVLLIAVLGGLFLTHAIVLRRDIDDRFDRFRVGLENHANAIVGEALKEHKRS